MTVSIDADRLWQSIMDIAAIGPTPEGGSCRLALSPEDAAARALLLRWCNPLDLRFEQDAIGNMFLRREGSDRHARRRSPSAAISTRCRPAAASTACSACSPASKCSARWTPPASRTRAPLELVNWTNEEGSRFRPAMMGSRVHAGDIAAGGRAGHHRRRRHHACAQALREQRPGRPVGAVAARLGLLARGAYRARPRHGGDRRRYRHRHRHCAGPLFPAHRYRRAEPRRSHRRWIAAATASPLRPRSSWQWSASRSPAEPDGRASRYLDRELSRTRAATSPTSRGLHCDVRHDAAASARSPWNATLRTRAGWDRRSHGRVSDRDRSLRDVRPDRVRSRRSVRLLRDKAAAAAACTPAT